MSNKIFLIGGDHGLRPMAEEPYEDEDALQSLLERYSDLLPGDQIDTDSPRRWLLVCREMGVPDDDDASDRWSLDHLFVDQDGIPTLVEVKRASDSRARREVVAQMLDYAANAVLYWPVEQIVSSFDRTVRATGREPAHVLAQFLATDADGGTAITPQQFWEKVKTNLEAERIRLVFIADSIPRELQRIVEFLNDQMDPAEVIAVEVKQFVGDGVKTLVPRVLGQSVKSMAKSGRQAGQSWTEESFMQKAAEESSEFAEVARKVADWFEANAAGVRWGHGRSGTFTARMLVDGEDVALFRVYEEGWALMSLMIIPDEAVRREFQKRIRAIDELKLGRGDREPGLENLAALAKPERWRQFSAACEWLLTKICNNANQKA